MSIYKFIHWKSDLEKNNDNKIFASIQIIYDSIPDAEEFIIHQLRKTLNQPEPSIYFLLSELLRKTFPQAVDNDIKYGKIVEPDHWYGCTIIVWNDYIPEGEYEGWHQCSNDLDEHCPSDSIRYISAN